MVITVLVYAQIRPPPDEQHLPLTFDFPEGNLIGIAKEKLPVTVTFTGTRPTSFTANVVFLDEDGKRFSLPITGTTDASVLTVQPFLEVPTHFLAHTALRWNKTEQLLGRDFCQVAYAVASCLWYV